MIRRCSPIYFCLIACITLISCGVSKSIKHLPPYDLEHPLPVVQNLSDSLLVAGDSFLQKNQHGLWELYVEGSPQELGLLQGALSQELLHYQEKVFFSKVEEWVPSQFKQFFLRQFLKWYNRKLYLHVPEAYQTEIYALSQYASPDYDFVAPRYQRYLYLHAAHDIGHALRDLALVGCSSLAVWDEASADGSLLIGRNFDFYAGDDFAKNKIIAFVAPDQGHSFVSVSWPGMVGVVSGMNTQGLTVTMNAGKSALPKMAKTPVSILARDILQNAQTTEEAIEIAKKTEVFVSESIMVGSAQEKKVILIEISPEKMDVYQVSNQNHLICSNHFQSDAYASDEANLKHILESHSQYRFDRMNELLANQGALNQDSMAAILRNVNGLNDTAIGYGNEKALNQLLAHHAVIFKPESLKIWVSTSPYQLGPFVCYDLNTVFGEQRQAGNTLSIPREEIPADPFLYSVDYQNYEQFRILNREFDQALSDKNITLSSQQIEAYLSSNPDYWMVYYKLGEYYLQKGYDRAAAQAFQKALTKEITTLPNRQMIVNKLKKINL